ncbi:hypothetical protein M3221_21275 [Domibacillus indicus]|uniref:hypothetical protein n=1 Tax=Domibacillus indicus TaxID=1437523 RepID=UPI00203D6C0F|nr:hypothetical protein [Domibacillus indicus]MCM3790880.1 hypothetical protein [Domibacillus indicus]
MDKWIILIVSILMLTGCRPAVSEENHLRLLFFTDKAMGQEAEIEQFLAEQVKLNKTIDVSIYPLSREKFSVLLAERAGDVYVAEPGLVEGLLTQNGLTPLDELMPVSAYPFVQEHYITNNKTGERHLYGLPLQTDQSAFAHLDLAIPEEMTIIVPSFSQNKKESLRALQALIN